MKSYKRLVAGTLALTLLLGAASCSKKTEETQQTEDTTITISTDVPSSDPVESTPQITNENGEYLVDGETFEERYGSQLQGYLNHQYYFDGKAIPMNESNYYMIHEFVEFNKMALQGNADLPLTSEGLVDLSHEFDQGVEYEGTDFKCVGDMVKFYAEVSLACSYIYMDLGDEYGIEISQTTKDGVEEQIEAIRELATETGLTLDQFLSVNYGPDFDEAAFREILLHYNYFDDFVAGYPIPEDMLEVPVVVHALFEARDGIATDEELETAKAKAEEFLAECTSPADIDTKGTELVSQGVVAECAKYSVIKDRFVHEFEDWAYDETRQVGDMEIVKTSYGYHVMGYLGVEPISESDRLSIASTLSSEEIYSVYYANVHEFYTKDEFEKPKPVAGDETTATTETAPSESLPLDENGNIIIETTAAPELKMGADKTSTGLTVTRVVAAVVAGVAIIAIIGLIIATVVKGDKNKDEDDNEEKKSSGKGKEKKKVVEEEPSEEIDMEDEGSED